MTLRVSDFLETGEANARPMAYLRSMLNLDSRAIRSMISAERLAGAPICANNCTGYFLAADDGERDRFCNSMRHRAAEIMAAAVAVEAAEVGR